MTTPSTFALGDAQGTFGILLPWSVPVPSAADGKVPEVCSAFCFVPKVCSVILTVLANIQRVFVHGPHGVGKSFHIEQVAAKLNWPYVRVSMVGHVTRTG